jgi:hypothetical protein
MEVKKTGYNSFAKYNYMQLADFTKPLVALLHEHDLVSFISFTDTAATLTIVDTTDGEQVQTTSPMSKASLKGCHEVQNLGAVQTYIRRYLYCAMFDIVEGDALDGSEPLKPTGIETNDLITTGSKKGLSATKIEKRLKEKFGHGMEYMTQAEHDEVLEAIKGMNDK